MPHLISQLLTPRLGDSSVALVWSEGQLAEVDTVADAVQVDADEIEVG